jgi:hypothetical protein
MYSLRWFRQVEVYRRVAGVRKVQGGGKMPTDLTPINSQNVSAAGYDAKTKELEVEFGQLGQRYRYQSVPAEVYAALTASERPGQYFAKFIKGVYPYTKESNE